MRLKTLHLERYGHFTDKRLEFREGACLHIVHGANEAGKTSSLAAITDLFFRFENKSPWDFLHPGKLSVGATITGADGASLTFKRRKGTKYTLTDAAGAAIPEDALDRYLGSLTRQTFSRAFGLSAKGLRRGAKEMLKSGGEVGASLFAAASGLRGLNELRASLATEAANIFMPAKSQSRSFYQALTRFEEAAKEIKDHEFRERDLKDRLAQIEQLQSILDAIRAQRRADDTRREELQRLTEVAPLLGAIAAQEHALQAWAAIPPIPAAALSRLRKAWQATQQAESAVDQLQTDHDDALRHAASFQIDHALLAEDAAIQSLQAQTGAFTEKKGQVSRVSAEGDHLRRELDAMRQRLGLPADADLESLQPADATLTRARRLLQQGRTVQQALRANTADRDQEQLDLNRLTAQRAASGAVEDPGTTRQRLRTLMPVLSQLDAADRARRKLELDQTRLSEDAASASPSIDNLETLATTGLPDPASIKNLATDWSASSETLTTSSRQVEAAKLAITRGQARRDQFEARSPVASPERIAQERTLRQAAWQQLRGILLEDQPRPSAGVLATNLLAFETSVQAADRLADQAIADADRLAEYLANDRQLAADERELTLLQSLHQAALATDAALNLRWLTLWQPIVAHPQPPPAMLLWLAEAQRLLDRRRTLLADAQEVRALDHQITQVLPELHLILAHLGLPDATNLPPKLALAAAETELANREHLWSSATELLIREQATTERLRLLDTTRHTLQQELTAWQLDWSTILPRLHLPADAGCDEAECVFALWQSMPDKTEALAGSTRRVLGMQRDMTTFKDQTAALLTRLAEPPSTVDADAVIKLLADRLAKARAQHSTQQEAARQAALLAGKLHAAQDLAHTRRADYTTQAASLPPTDDPTALLDSLDQREAALQDLAAKRQLLASLARNQTESDLHDALAGWDETHARVTITELRRKDATANIEESTAFSNLKDARRDLDALQTGHGAELALQLKRNAEAELLQHTHDWAVKRIGQILLTAAVEHHRTRQEQPLLRRASQLFALLTAGSFLSIEQEPDSNEEKVSLVGRRDSQHTVCLSGMSTGTRDQLYLALRLAYLEQYAASTEAVPFIGDDLFTSSDESRTAQGLKALAATGHLIQPILFTHHQHVVDLACKELGNGVDVILLGG